MKKYTYIFGKAYLCLSRTKVWYIQLAVQWEEKNTNISEKTGTTFIPRDSFVWLQQILLAFYCLSMH